MAEWKAMRGQEIVKKKRKRGLFFSAQMEFAFFVFNSFKELGGWGVRKWSDWVQRQKALDSFSVQMREEKRLPCPIMELTCFSDGEPLVLGANVDGYIPMKFSSGSVLQVTGIPITYSPQIIHKSRNKDVAKPWKMQVSRCVLPTSCCSIQAISQKTCWWNVGLALIVYKH